MGAANAWICSGVGRSGISPVMPPPPPPELTGGADLPADLHQRGERRDERERNENRKRGEPRSERGR